jgi:hypothetical protein
MNPESRITRLTLAPPNEPIFSERATHVEIADEGGGEHLVLRQSDEGRIAFDPEEWPVIQQAVATLLQHIKTTRP